MISLENKLCFFQTEKKNIFHLNLDSSFVAEEREMRTEKPTVMNALISSYTSKGKM